MADRPDDATETASAAETRQQALDSIGAGMVAFAPHNRALGMRFVSFEGAVATVALPYDEKLIGNPLTGVIAGGAITALMDMTCGAAVFASLREPLRIATLDLRIDYLRPATPRREIHARANCFKVTREVAFVRCDAFHPEDERDLVAVANGTFILFRKAPPTPESAP